MLVIHVLFIIPRLLRWITDHNASNDSDATLRLDSLVSAPWNQNYLIDECPSEYIPNCSCSYDSSGPPSDNKYISQNFSSSQQPDRVVMSFPIVHSVEA